MKEKSRKKIWGKISKSICWVFGLTMVFAFLTNAGMIYGGKKNIPEGDVFFTEKADCILILGAGVVGGDRPSLMLKDRLEEGIRLYNLGVSDKILVSGDHGQKNYDEVNVMKNYLMEAGIPGEDIFMDHAGFSTYESAYRAKEIFGVETAVVVTQEYHMYRAIFDCQRMGIDTRGSCAAKINYKGALYRNIREVVARDKDLFFCLFKVKPTYLGEKVDIHGNGNVTNG